ITLPAVRRRNHRLDVQQGLLEKFEGKLKALAAALRDPEKLILAKFLSAQSQLGLNF
ncbi:MAG: hypothetical protein CYPHOPRED_004386, partial [Cyphobasidiales sp. Tagirdzhanova-0007]